MKKLLIVVDYQNDFINGSLGFEGADSIYPFIKEKIQEYEKKWYNHIFKGYTFT
jgi:nicotinamidase/pyrazinamidase